MIRLFYLVVTLVISCVGFLILTPLILLSLLSQPTEEDRVRNRLHPL
jgi:hypothetical protein